MYSAHVFFQELSVIYQKKKSRNKRKKSRIFSCSFCVCNSNNIQSCRTLLSDNYIPTLDIFAKGRLDTLQFSVFQSIHKVAFQAIYTTIDKSIFSAVLQTFGGAIDKSVFNAIFQTIYCTIYKTIF